MRGHKINELRMFHTSEQEVSVGRDQGGDEVQPSQVHAIMPWAVPVPASDR